MIVEWKENMRDCFSPSYVTCLDESMSIWNNKWSCPGWIFCPRKPHPFGNEWHTISCGLTGILFDLEIVEGKDRPKEFGIDSSNRFGATGGILLRLCRSIYASGRIVVLDSGFCVLAALIQLRKMGIFAHAVIKKRRYWPKYIAGDDIDAHMKQKKVGEIDIMTGKLSNESFYIFNMKEPAFNMKIMSTYGDKVVPENQENTRRFFKDETGITVKREFKYTTVFYNHFKYRHSIDDHNNLRHSVPSLEETWITHRWPNRVFSFLLAISEINTYLALKYFVWKKKGENIPTIHQFRRKLALSLIYNPWLDAEEEKGIRRKRKKCCDHVICTAPAHAKKITLGKWDTSAKEKYQRYTCQSYGCKKRTRTYCSCGVGDWMCSSCFVRHSVDLATSEDSL